VAPNFGRESWRPKRGGESPAQVIVAFTVAKPPVMDKLTSTVYFDVLKPLGTWHTVGKRPAPTRVISASRRTSGYGGRSGDRARAYPGAKIFSPPADICTQSARIATPARITARSSLATHSLNLKIFFVHCTIRIFFSLSDRAYSGVFFFNSYVTT
jgi:hypothetical protein